MQNSPQSLNLAPLQLPQEPELWPLAWGWWAVAIVAILAILGAALLFKQYRAKRHAKRIAQDKLKQIKSAKDGMQLLRQAALSYFPRAHIASLSGRDWYAFLDQQLKAPRFLSKASTWDELLYMPSSQSGSTSQPTELLSDIEYWINHALPPRRSASSSKEGR
ncbi:DUF4381 domain-containing protein [Vibrio penaeicida]|uniref:DUF4381 domain-containing protein n=1 Tax=Vibrio penaeicida TaxID=104609 RepID=A0AAV5NZP9_9VIBR|nr:DUF4381 domain-containing protein [Vibrio penaeicida]RTZ20605.1 DUF4381 domain-containing protein [Vibrio penaeicida]GLQ75784.1 hypothetical protein GCM10007932_51470 [Vibrio penaeicida]